MWFLLLALAAVSFLFILRMHRALTYKMEEASSRERKGKSIDLLSLDWHPRKRSSLPIKHETRDFFSFPEHPSEEKRVKRKVLRDLRPLPGEEKKRWREERTARQSMGWTPLAIQHVSCFLSVYGQWERKELLHQSFGSSQESIKRLLKKIAAESKIDIHDEVLFCLQVTSYAGSTWKKKALTCGSRA